MAPVFLPMVAQQIGSWRYSFAFAGFVVIGSAIIVALFYHDRHKIAELFSMANTVSGAISSNF